MTEFDLSLEEYENFVRPALERFHAENPEQLDMGRELWEATVLPPVEGQPAIYKAREQAVGFLAQILEDQCFSVKLTLPAQMAVMRIVERLLPKHTLP